MGREALGVEAGRLHVVPPRDHPNVETRDVGHRLGLAKIGVDRVGVPLQILDRNVLEINQRSTSMRISNTTS